ALKAVDKPLADYIQSAEDIFATCAKNAEEAEKQFPAFDKTFSELETQMSAISDVIEEFGKEVVAQNQSAKQAFHKQLLIAVAGSIGLLIVLTIFVVRSIPKPFAAVAARLSASAASNANYADHIMSAATSAAQDASAQAASLEETSASLEEMASRTKNNA